LEVDELINTIKDIWYALTSPESYRDFMNYKRRTIFLYVFVLTFAASIIIYGIPAAQFMANGGFETLVETGIPEFSASSEEGFWIEEPIEIDEYNFLIKADSNVVRDDITDLDGQYGSYEYVVMVDKEQIHIDVPGIQDYAARFDEMQEFHFSKDDVRKYIPVMYLGSIWTFVLGILVDFGYYFVVSAMVSWMAGLIASFMKVRLGNKRLFKMAVYAGTLSYILLFIQTVIGKTVPNFTFFSYVITLGYMYFAIKDFKEYAMEELPPEGFGGREDNL
jgi:hypothetical protein